MSKRNKKRGRGIEDIDIIDINMILFSSYRMKVNKPYPLFVCYILFLAYCIRNLFRFEFKYKALNRCLFLVPSLNNRRTLSPIYQRLDSKDYTTLEGYRFELPWSRVVWKSLCCLPHFHRTYKKQNTEDKKLIRHFYTIFLTTYGIYYVTEQLLEKNPATKLIVMANDHLTFCRIINMLAPTYGIKTIYTQHASVTERFPALNFTYSFLDGMDSYNKYRSIAPIRGEVFLSGSPRFDELKNVKLTKTDNIGIACNSIDKLDKVLDLVNHLIESTNWMITVRPHPLMQNTFPKELFNNPRIEFSNPIEESSFQFLARLKVLIANESSIHLDSLLVGTPTVLYNFTDDATIDWYGYLRSGLMQKCESKEHIVRHISQATVSTEKVKHFYAAYKTPYEHCVGELIAQFIGACIYHENDESESNFSDKGGYFEYKSNDEPCD